MPTPNKGEEKDKFISRCISYVMKEEPGIEHDHAIAKCYGIWEQDKKNESIINRIDGMLVENKPKKLKR